MTSYQAAVPSAATRPSLDPAAPLYPPSVSAGRDNLIIGTVMPNFSLCPAGHRDAAPFDPRLLRALPQLDHVAIWMAYPELTAHHLLRLRRQLRHHLRAVQVRQPQLLDARLGRLEILDLDRHMRPRRVAPLRPRRAADNVQRVVADERKTLLQLKPHEVSYFPSGKVRAFPPTLPRCRQ